MYPYLFAGTVFETDVWDVCVIVGFLIVLTIGLVKRPKDFPMGYGGIFGCSLLIAYLGFIGAKLLYLLLHSEAAYVLFKDKRSLFPIFMPASFATAGSAFLGAFFLEFLGIFVFTRFIVRQVSFLKVADYFAPFLLLHQAFVRVGCFFSGCCYGKPTDLPWGCVFRGHLPSRHPTQIYEMVVIIAIFFIMRHLYKKGLPEGVTFLGTLFLYTFLRFFNEFLRVDSPPLFWSLTLAQVTMITIAALSGLAILKIFMRRKI